MLNKKVHDLERLLENKDKELQKQHTSHINSRNAIRKHDSILELLQLVEQQIHSTLTRQEAACEVIEYLRNDLQEAKFETEKGMFDLKEKLSMLDCFQSQSDDYEAGIEMHETCPQQQQALVYDIKMKQHVKEASQPDQMQEEDQKLSPFDNILNHEDEILKRESCQLPESLLNKEMFLASTTPEGADGHMVCKIAPAIGLSSNNSTFDEATQENRTITKKPRRPDIQQSNSIIISENGQSQETQDVRHPKPKAMDTGEKDHTSSEQGIDALQEELARRQRNWKQSEQKMRAELCRRMSQLRETHEQFPSLKELWAHPHHRHMPKKQPFM